jgi:tRNA A-37 threonylcarbamoyl transferase component Bud32
VHALLVHLEQVGFGGAPKSLGLDSDGRHVMEWIPGDLALPYLELSEDGRRLQNIGSLVRRFHDAVASFRPPEDAVWNIVIPCPERSIICHHDLAPWNFVAGLARSAFIDWDLAAPGSPLWDLALCAHGFLPLDGSVPAHHVGQRLRYLVDGYGLNGHDRRRLVELLPERSHAMFELLRSGFESASQPWAQLWAEGHGKVWSTHTDFAERTGPVLLRWITSE